MLVCKCEPCVTKVEKVVLRSSRERMRRRGRSAQSDTLPVHDTPPRRRARRRARSLALASHSSR
eukprot:4517295-Prymnesium_polylepis.1